MSFWYSAILRPSDVRFTCNEISTKFKNGRLLQALLDELLEGKKLVKDLPALEVVWYLEKWEWYTLDNKMLWVFQELENAGKISYIEMRRMISIGRETNPPNGLYKSAITVATAREEPTIDRPPAVEGGKKGRDVKLLSKALRRFHLSKFKSTEKESDFQAGKGEELAKVNPQLAKCSDPVSKASSSQEMAEQTNEDAQETTEKLRHNEGILVDSESIAEFNDCILKDSASSCRGDFEQIDSTYDSALEDVEEELGPKKSSPLPEALDVVVKEEADDNIENGEIDDALSICHSLPSSVCSLLLVHIDQADRTVEKSSLSLDEGGLLSEDDWVEIESIGYVNDKPVYESKEKAFESKETVFESKEKAVDINGNICDVFCEVSEVKKEDTVEEWLNDRKKFCRSSKDSHFNEYVADHINPRKPKQSLSQSLSSLDSAFSSALSLITREQRQISLLSGLSGYGNFDKYNRDYLSKLRSERKASKRRLKPYNVSNSRHGRARSWKSSLCGDDVKGEDEIWRQDSRVVVCMKDRVRRRNYSENDCISYRETRQYSSWSTARSSSVSYHSSDARMRRRERSFSETEFVHHDSSRRRSYSSSTTNRPKMYSRSLSGSSWNSYSEHKMASMSTSSTYHSLSKEELYSTWQMRREGYMKAKYRHSSLRRVSGDSMALRGYTCGLCFKTFKTRTSREQHSDELMHWACITCGRFFASHTALGQHVDQMGHRKD